MCVCVRACVRVCVRACVYVCDVCMCVCICVWRELPTSCRLNTSLKLSVSWQFFETYDVINHGSSWRNDDVNQCLEFSKSLIYDPYSIWVAFSLT